MVVMWLSPAELAGLPNIPSSLANARKKAEREGWESRERQGRGGGKEYRLPNEYLTPDMLEALRLRGFEFAEDIHTTDKDREAVSSATAPDFSDNDEFAGDTPCVEVPDQPTAPPAAVADFSLGVRVVEEPAPTKNLKHLRALARKEVADIWLNKRGEIRESLGLSERMAADHFCDLLNSGQIAIPAWVREGLISVNSGRLQVSRASLLRWAELSVDELLDRRGGKDGFFDLSPDCWKLAEGLLQQLGVFATPLAIWNVFQKGEGEKPSYSQVRTWLRNYQRDYPVRYRAAMTGDLRVLDTAFGSYAKGLVANDQWQIDSTLIDVKSGTDEGFSRCYAVQVTDVATGMRLFYLSPTSKALAIKKALHKAICKWGVPVELKTDNGKDYAGRQLEAFLAGLEIKHRFCKPFSPEQKPMVERGFGVLQHDPDFRLLNGFVGHSVAQRQAIRERDGEIQIGMRREELQAWLDGWCDRYHCRYHERLGCTPLEKLAEFTGQGWRRRVLADRSVLDWLLLEVEVRTLTKKGLRLNGGLYCAPELGSLEAGRKVEVRYDPENLAEVQVFADGEFICVARWELALSPEEQLAVARSAKRLRSQVKAEMAEARKLGKRAIKNAEKIVAKQLTEGVPPAEFVREEKFAPAIAEMAKQVIDAPAVREEDPEQRAMEIAAMMPKPKPKYKTDEDYEAQMREVLGLWRQGLEPDQALLDDVLRWYQYGRGVQAVIFFEAPNEVERKAFLRWLNSKKPPAKVVNSN